MADSDYLFSNMVVKSIRVSVGEQGDLFSEKVQNIVTGQYYKGYRLISVQIIEEDEDNFCFQMMFNRMLNSVDETIYRITYGFVPKPEYGNQQLVFPYYIESKGRFEDFVDITKACLWTKGYALEALYFNDLQKGFALLVFGR